MKTSATHLLVSQRHYRIEIRGAPRRNVGCSYGNECQHSRRTSQNEWIARTHSVKQSRSCAERKLLTSLRLHQRSRAVFRRSTFAQHVSTLCT